MYTNWFSNGIKYFEDVYDITAKALYIEDYAKNATSQKVIFLNI